MKQVAKYVLACFFEEKQKIEGTYIVPMNRPKIQSNSIMNILFDVMFQYNLLTIQPFNGKEDIIFLIKHPNDNNFYRG